MNKKGRKELKRKRVREAKKRAALPAKIRERQDRNDRLKIYKQARKEHNAKVQETKRQHRIRLMKVLGLDPKQDYTEEQLKQAVDLFNRRQDKLREEQAKKKAEAGEKTT